MERIVEFSHFMKEEMRVYTTGTTFKIPSFYPARAMRALGLLLADGAPIVG